MLRTGICLLLAGAYLTLAAQREADVPVRVRMVRLLAVFQVVGALLAYAGYRWWEFVLPGSVRAIFLGAKPLLAALGSTRHLVLWALAAYLLVALFALAAPRFHRWPTAVVAMLVAFAFFGGFERLREGRENPS